MQEQRTHQMRALLRELREQALELPGVVVSLPTSWRGLQLWLTKAAQPAAGAEKTTQNLFQAVAEVEAAAVATCGFGAGDTESVTQALALFHDWGLVVDARAVASRAVGEGEGGGGGAVQRQEQQQQHSGGIIVIDPPALADVMQRVATAVPGNVVRARKGVLRHADLAQVWADYPSALHAPLLDLLHTFEVAFPLRNTRGDEQGVSVIVPMLGGMDDALQGRDLDGE